MALSLSSAFTGLLFCAFITILVSVMLKNSKKGFSLAKINFLQICCLLAIFRMTLPVEFTFTKAVKSNYFLPLLIETVKKGNYGLKLMQFLLAISICGTVIIAINRIKIGIRLNRILKYSKPVKKEIIEKVKPELSPKIKIVELNYLSEPIITGFFHPKIVLPSECLESIYLPFVLKHEIEHYKHHDIWIKTLLEVLCIIMWWNPLIHLLNRHMSNILEFHDDLIINKKLTKKERIKYSECLLEIAKDKNTKKLSFSLGFQHIPKSFFERRILSIINYNSRSSKKYILGYLTVSFIFIISLCTVIEPYYITNDKVQDSFSFENKNTFLVREGEGYILNVDGEVVGYVNELSPELQKIEIKGE